MTDELQTDAGDSGITLDNDHIEIEETTNAEETTEGGAELATASGDDQTKNDDGVQKAINKQHAKFREEERKRIAIEKEAVELREKLAAIEAEKGDVEIPALPDIYDDDYEAQLKQREEAIKRQAIQEAQKNVLTEQQNAQKEVAAQAEVERQNNLVKGFNGQITKLGLNPEEIGAAVDTVVSYGIDSALGEFILQQEDGPLITKYLANNPLELDDLRNMSPIDAALTINSKIKQASSKLKPEATTAPDPAETLSGKGVGEKKHPLIKGASFV